MSMRGKSRDSSKPPNQPIISQSVLPPSWVFYNPPSATFSSKSLSYYNATCFQKKQDVLKVFQSLLTRLDSGMICPIMRQTQQQLQTCIEKLHRQLSRKCNLIVMDVQSIFAFALCQVRFFRKKTCNCIAKNYFSAHAVRSQKWLGFACRSSLTQLCLFLSTQPWFVLLNSCRRVYTVRATSENGKTCRYFQYIILQAYVSDGKGKSTRVHHLKWYEVSFRSNRRTIYEHRRDFHECAVVLPPAVS